MSRLLPIVLIVALVVAAGLVVVFAQSSAQSTLPPTYIAYRAVDLPADVRRQVQDEAVAAGLAPIRDSALDREGLLVFAAFDESVIKKTGHLFKDMLPVPIRDFRGVLSVPTGNFYLRMRDDVSAARARLKIERLGFKILTPPSDPSALLVVVGTGLPENRDKELDRLKQLRELQFVAPNDIPLKLTVTQ